MAVRYSITIRQHRSVRRLIEAIPEEAWTPIPYCSMVGPTYPETTYTPFADQKDAVPVRLIVRRVRPTPGSQLALFALYDYHAFITDREGETLVLETDHRRHAEIENAIRDLQYGVGLNHLPSGKFAANGAWLAVQVIAHNQSPLDRPAGAGRRDRDDQDAAPAAVRSRRPAHPLGSPLDAPSADSLAVGDRSPRGHSRGCGRSRSWPDSALTVHSRLGAGGSL